MSSPNPPAGLDPRTPVLVGAGQVSERLGQPGYRCRSAADLAGDAARAALFDTGADPAELAAAIDTVAGVRQFENSFPGARAPLGRSDNFPRSVANRIGADPARAVLEVTGGQAPQHLVNEFAGVIAAGDCIRGPAGWGGGHFHGPALCKRSGPARFQRAGGGQPGGPRVRAGRSGLGAADRARADRADRPSTR